MPRHRARRLPALPLIATVIGLVAVDMGAAGTALAVFAPPELALAPVIAAFTLAISAGLISGTPGGLGAFELTLLATLSDQDIEPVLSAVLCFRVVYYAVPALLAAAAILPGSRLMGRARAQPGLRAETTPPPNALRAEAGLLAQPGAMALCDATGTPHALARRTRQALVMIGDGFTGAAPFATLQDIARREGRLPAAYKIGARDALRARTRGWAVMRTGHEALIVTPLFDPATPAHRQLRRTLKQAETAGVSVARATHPLPLADMAAIDAAWCARQGGARGFSMGRFCPVYVAGQEVWLARQNGRLVGFITLHRGRFERTLDLMRQTDDAPGGTMHLIVTAALKQARCDGIARVSLAAVPGAALPARLRAWADRCTGAPGLRPFKAAFNPSWRHLYIAAPTHAALALAALDIARAMTAPHDDHEPSSFAHRPVPWQTGAL